MWWKWPLVFLLSPSCHQQEGWILLLHDPQRSLLRAVSPSPSLPHLMAPIRDWGLPYQGNSHFPQALSIHGFSNSLPLSSPCSISTPFLPSYKNTRSRLALIQDQGQQSQRQERSKVQQAPVQVSSGSPCSPGFLPTSPHLLRLSSSPHPRLRLWCLWLYVSSPPSFYLCPSLGLSGDKCVHVSLSPHSLWMSVCLSFSLCLSPDPHLCSFSPTPWNVCVCVCVCKCVSICCVLGSQYLTLPRCFSCSVSVCLSSGLFLGLSLQQHPLGLHFGGSRRRPPTHPSQSSLPCQMELISYGRKKLHSDLVGGGGGRRVCRGSRGGRGGLLGCSLKTPGP